MKERIDIMMKANVFFFSKYMWYMLDFAGCKGLGIPQTKRLSVREQMAEAAGTPLVPVHVLQMLDLEIEADLACMEKLFWAEAVCGWCDATRTGRSVGTGMHGKPQAASQNADQVFETNDLGISFRWHALLLEEDIIVHLKVICAVKTKARNQTTEILGMWWVANHVCEWLKDGVWVEPLRTLKKRKIQLQMDNQSCQCGQEAHCQRRLDAEKSV